MRSTLVQMIKDVVENPTYGAEIGVYKGETSRLLLQTFPNLLLHMVDPWKQWSEDSSYRRHKRTGNLTQKEWDFVAIDAIGNVMEFENRYIIVKSTSHDAAEFIDGLDFVFLDGNHMYEHIKEDIDLWILKIKQGGLLAGHDFGGRYKGVVKAVDNKFGRENLILPGKRLWGYVVK